MEERETSLKVKESMNAGATLEPSHTALPPAPCSGLLVSHAPGRILLLRDDVLRHLLCSPAGLAGGCWRFVISTGTARVWALSPAFTSSFYPLFAP